VCDLCFQEGVQEMERDLLMRQHAAGNVLVVINVL